MWDKRKAEVKALNSKERGSKHHVFKFWTADVEFKKKKKKNSLQLLGDHSFLAPACCGRLRDRRSGSTADVFSGSDQVRLSIV